MRLSMVRYMSIALLFGCAMVTCSCASCLSPVEPIVTPDACKKLTTCGECISNEACGYCGNACMAAVGADKRDTAPPACTGQWVWKIGTCPDTAPPATHASRD